MDPKGIRYQGVDWICLPLDKILVNKVKSLKLRERKQFNYFHQLFLFWKRNWLPNVSYGYGLLFTVTFTNTELFLMNCMIGESNSEQSE